MEELSQYNMTIKHRKGKDHVNADALFRIADDECPFYKSEFNIR
jgi:hypothetical protein